MNNDIVIEVRGGCLVGVYSNNRDQRVVLMDWDDLNEVPETARLGGIVPINPFYEMRKDTQSLYDRTASK